MRDWRTEDRICSGSCTVFAYHAGAFAFALFGGYQRERESWELSDGLYHVAFRAVNADRARRQPSLRALREEWETALAHRMK